MLKIKKNKRVHANKQDAMDEVLKEDEVKRLNAEIPKSIYTRLKSKLAEDDMSISEWVRDCAKRYLL
jgi:hypothetical protein